MSFNDTSWNLKIWQAPHIEHLTLMRVSNVTHDYPRHIHEEYCIGIILHGTETLISAAGKSYKAVAGDLLLLNAEEAHANNSVESEYRGLEIHPKKINQIAEELFGRSRREALRFSNPLVKDSKLYRLLLELHLKIEQNVSALEQESEFISTIGLLIQKQNANSSVLQSVGKEKRYIERTSDYLRSNYAENISLSDLASVTDLSPFHLLRVFRNQTGVPPHEYQTQVRIRHVQRLIRSGRSILEAALETGFFDQSHLSRNFKRITGMTPGYYLMQSGITPEKTKAISIN